MKFEVRPYAAEDIPAMRRIWNDVVACGKAFPQDAQLTLEEARDFFASQIACGVAKAGTEILGLYILHPNNVGRCGHICNASYAVDRKARGMGVGESLVAHSLVTAKKAGFGIMQFNAVCADNYTAHKLYEKMGFNKLGAIPAGFRRDDGSCVDIHLYYKTL